MEGPGRQVYIIMTTTTTTKAAAEEEEEGGRAGHQSVRPRACEGSTVRQAPPTHPPTTSPHPAPPQTDSKAAGEREPAQPASQPARPAVSEREAVLS